MLSPRLSGLQGKTFSPLISPVLETGPCFLSPQASPSTEPGPCFSKCPRQPPFFFFPTKTLRQASALPPPQSLDPAFHRGCSGQTPAAQGTSLPLHRNPSRLSPEVWGPRPLILTRTLLVQKPGFLALHIDPGMSESPQGVGWHLCV